MEALLPLIIQLVSGAVGGNVVGKIFSGLNLGTLVNSVAGIVGGGLGGTLLGLMGIAAAPSGALDLASIAGSIGSGAVGGGVLLAVVGFVKKLLR
jgi:uncharacterized membrane protein YeaQ/YmgE (transglycosylase-associated protein family)